MAEVAGTAVNDLAGAGLPDGGAGERPSQLFGGPLRTDHRGAEAVRAADRALPLDLQPAAPRAGRLHAVPAAPAGGAQRSVAVPAARGFAAVLADQRHEVARPRHLDEHRSLRQHRAHQREHLVRQPCRLRRRVALERAVGVGAHLHLGRGVPDRGPGLPELADPAPLHPRLELRRPGVAREECGRPALRRPQGQHLAGVRVGRPGFGQQVVAVVPQRDEAEVPDRGEGRGPVADHHPDLPPEGPQEGPVPGRRSRLGDEHGEAGRSEGLAAGLLQQLDVALVGDDEHRTPAAVDRGPCGGGEPAGPVAAAVGAGRHLPGGPRAPAPGHGREEGGSGRVVRQRVRRDRRQLGDRGHRRRRLLGRGVPGRHGEPHHVGEAAGVVVGHPPDQPGDLGGEHGFGRDDLGERAQAAVVVAGVAPLQQEAVALLAGEADPDPRPGHRLLVLGGRDGVVEGPVEVAQREVEDDAADRLDRGSGEGRRSLARGLGGPRLRHTR